MPGLALEDLADAVSSTLALELSTEQAASAAFDPVNIAAVRIRSGKMRISCPIKPIFGANESWGSQLSPHLFFGVLADYCSNGTPSKTGYI